MFLMTCIIHLTKDQSKDKCLTDRDKVVETVCLLIMDCKPEMQIECNKQMLTKYQTPFQTNILQDSNHFKMSIII